MRFRRKSRGASDDESLPLPPLAASDVDRTQGLDRPASGASIGLPVTTTVMADGLRAPNPEDLIAPAVWDDDEDDTSEVAVPGGTAMGAAGAGSGRDGVDWEGVHASDQADATAKIATPGKARTGRRWRLEDWGAILIMTALSLLVVDRHVANYQPISSVAEVQNIDLAYKLSRFEVPRPGDELGTVATRAAACRGIEGEAPPVEKCEEGDNLQRAVTGEYNWETSARSVPYYFLTGMMARAGESVGLFDDFVQAARWTGAIWLALGWAVVWYVMSVLGISRRRRAAIVSVFVATPLLTTPATFVGSSASLFFVGALVLLATVKYATGAWSWWTTALIFLVGYLFEPMMAPFEIVYLLFLAFQAWRKPQRRFGQVAFPVISIGVLVAMWAWGGRWISEQVLPPIPRPRSGGGEPTPGRGQLADIVSATLMPIANTFAPRFLDTAATRLLLTVSSWLVTALVGSVALIGRSTGRITVMARWVLAGMVIISPLVAWQLANAYGLSTPFSSFLVLPFVAALVVIAGTALVTRTATVLSALVGIAVIANEIWVLFFA